MNFRQNFRQKKNFRHFKKTLAETNNCIPQDLRNEGPLAAGPFAQPNLRWCMISEPSTVCHPLYTSI